MQIRLTADPCAYEGDPEAPIKAFITGFEPFPANARHGNVSLVGVTHLDPSRLSGVQVMRVILPVEYDTAAARVADIIERCEPDVVINFGQGGGRIALEETAYNLKDTGEIPGGAPDNRGVIATATPIDPEGPAERTTGLPLSAIEGALQPLERVSIRSDDPGRYICNNVFYTVMGVVEGTEIQAGFVHLPYTSWYAEGDRERWGQVIEAIVQGVADAR